MRLLPGIILRTTEIDTVPTLLRLETARTVLTMSSAATATLAMNLSPLDEPFGLERFEDEWWPERVLGYVYRDVMLCDGICQLLCQERYQTVPCGDELIALLDDMKVAHKLIKSSLDKLARQHWLPDNCDSYARVIETAVATLKCCLYGDEGSTCATRRRGAYWSITDAVRASAMQE